MFDIVLGIMTSLGGFVDIGELVFAIAGGTKFGYTLLWVVLLGTIGIILYAEMAGRIAAVTHKPVFEVIRLRLGFRIGLGVLVASNLVNLLTCAAEIGGIAIVLQLLFGFEYRLMLLASLGLLLLGLYFLKFRSLERVFGLLGLFLLVYAWAAVKLGVDWAAAGYGLIPQWFLGNGKDALVYGYFVVGLFSSILMPYEVYFYSSGGIEDGWTVKDIPENILNAGIGFTLGGMLTMALIVVGAQVFMPQGIEPKLLSTTVMPSVVALGLKGMLLALLGILFAVGGAAVETALAGAYDIAQFFHLPWGKSRPPGQVTVFTGSWMAMIILGCAIAMSGVNPVDIVEYSVIFAVVVLPFTYYPILQAARDKKFMGSHANSPLITFLGWIYFVLITLAGLCAVPLMLMTHMGDG